jgi:hypothetical protein
VPDNEKTLETATVDKNRQQSLSLEEIVHLANKIGLEYVKARQEVDHYDLLKASHRAKTMEKHDDGSKSEAKLRRLAEIDAQYIEFIEKLNNAKFEAEKLKIRYESYKNLFEARRSMLSYQKAEMQLL